jgi:hypothetical protein
MMIVPNSDLKIIGFSSSSDSRRRITKNSPIPRRDEEAEPLSGGPAWRVAWEKVPKNISSGLSKAFQGRDVAIPIEVEGA